MIDNEINKHMDKKMQDSIIKTQPTTATPTKQPDERSGIHVQGHIKIFDPQTNEVFVNGRA
jgi:hypothetical protein